MIESLEALLRFIEANKIISVGLGAVSTSILWLCWHWAKPAAVLTSSTIANLKKETLLFVANNFELNGKTYGADTVNPVKEFIQLLRAMNNKDYQKNYFFLIAPTGIGKTTFLKSAFLRYRNRSFFTMKKVLIFGDIHHPNTIKELEEIQKRTSTSKGRNFFLSLRKKKNILLLDGLDEFIGGNRIESVEDYWIAFNDQWKKLLEILKNFDTIVIAIREQFYTEGILGKNATGFISSIGNHNIIPICLQPFTSDQINEYIDGRYEIGSVKAVALRKFVQTIAKLNPSDNLLSIPLVLTYIEDLYEARLKVQYVRRQDELYGLIADKWAERESFKIWPDSIKANEAKSQLLNFCEMLSAEIVASSQLEDSITLEKYHELELSILTKSGVGNLLSRLGNRSLLAKRGLNNDYIGFAHQRFLTYFLGRRAQSLASISLKKRDVDWKHNVERINTAFVNPNYTMAYDMSLRQCWERSRVQTKNLPSPSQQTILTSDILHSVLDSRALCAWLDFAENISPFPIQQLALRNNLGNCLKRYDGNWRKYFSVLECLVITNQNFFVGHPALPNDKIYNRLEYYHEFITAIMLHDVVLKQCDPKIFECFARSNKIKILSLSEHELTDSIWMKPFANNKHELIALHLQGNCFTGEVMEIFKNFNQIIATSIYGNNISPEYFINFSGCASTLTTIDLRTNISPLNNSLEFLPDNSLWQRFYVNSSKLEYIFSRFLNNATSSLVGFGNDYSDTTDSQIELLNRYKHIENLSLTCNNIIGLSFPKLNLPKLKRIGLAGNPLCYDSLSCFVNYNELEEIDIYGCPPQNPQIIKHLRLNGVQVNERPLDTGRD